MRILEDKKIYQDTEKYVDIKLHIHDAIQFSLLVEFQSEKFIEYQKDLIQEFVADFVDGIEQSEEYDPEALRIQSETALQKLNTKFKDFADKVRDVEYFSIKGYMQIVIGTTLISSMIGNTTIMILRDHKIYYTLHNSTKVRGKIDLFSEFIEGDLESGDEILYVGTKISDVLDNYDIKEVEQILKSEESKVVDFMDELLSSRIEDDNIGFLSGYTVQGLSRKHHAEKSKISLNAITSKMGFLQEWKEKFFKNKYQVTVGILSLFIVFMVYSLVNQLLKKPQGEVYVNPQGVTVDLTIDDIKKDIAVFKSMDPTGEEKAAKYQDIENKISILEKKGRWIEDLQQLKKVIKADYNKGFNIITVSDLKQFDDQVLGRKSEVIVFNQSEKTTLGEAKNIQYAKDILVAGTKAALLGIVNENSRGSLVSYNIEDVIDNCVLSLMKNGFYCYTANGKIYAITRGGIETLTTADPDGFPMAIGGIGTYGKSNMYVFAKNVTSLSDSTLVIRYRNTLGSQSVYQQGQKYMIAPGLATGLNFGSGFSNFAIDVNFLGWSNGKLYQFRRNPATSFNLEYRDVKLMGGDTKAMQLSNDVKIITPENSRYLYLFDKTNQTFMVYDSRPLKTNTQYATNYSLYYMFSFAFDLPGGNKVVDAVIPDELGNRPELYVLTQDGVNKILLYEFIDSIKNNNVLKQIN